MADPNFEGSRERTLTNQNQSKKEEPLERELKSGYLGKKEASNVFGKKWTEYYFVLYANVLSWWKNEKEFNEYKTRGKRRPKPKGDFLIKQNGKVTPNIKETDREFCFIIQVANNQLTLTANSQIEVTSWSRLLGELFSGATDMTKESIEIQEKLASGQTSAGLEIDPNTIEFGQNSQIGSGASGIVRKGTWLGTTDVAIKALKNLPEFTDSKELTSFFREIEVLSGLRHVNILQMFGYCKKDKYLCLVTEYVKDGSLSDKLKARVQIPLWKQVEICRGVAAGMSYLHAQTFIHRDLKPGNILIANFNEGSVKVCDFGLSVKSTKREANDETTFGSPQYAAPELSKPDHTFKVDVFSFAIVVWELSVGSPKGRALWPDVKFGWMFAEKYSQGQRPPVTPEECVFFTLLGKCWQTKPELRPTFAEVFQDLNQISAKVGKRTDENESKPQNPSMMSPANRALPKAPTIESTLLEGFKSRSAIPWLEFVTLFTNQMNANNDEVKKLAYLLMEVKTIQVPRTNLERFMNWFRPLTVRDFYQTEESSDANGYSIETIINICGPTYFHGFLSSSIAQQMLKGQPDGTYLFRFSTSSAGDYALSCSYNNHVGHWRIGCTMKNGIPAFSIDGRTYDSLQNIISCHGYGKEPLKVKEHKPNQLNAINLMTPFPRSDFQIPTPNDFYN